VLVAPPALGIHNRSLDLRSLGRDMSVPEREATVRHNLQVLMLDHPAAIDDMAVALHAWNFERDRLRLRRLARSEIMRTLQTQWRCPVHAIWGREDALARHAIDTLRGALADCDLRDLVIIDGAGHWVQYEQAQAFDRALGAILDT
jgi:pimeloyl-ACP methyl ester carboxylesterase